MPYRVITALALIAATLQVGCGDPDQPTVSAEPEKTAAPAAQRNPKIPVEVSCPIIKDEQEYNAITKKRMVDVRLNMKVSPEILREIALEVRSQETRQYERTFVSIYLPESQFGAEDAPWATCHFNPTLEVRILGLTKEDEESLRRMPLTHPGKRIGAWFLETQVAGRISLIFEDAGVVKLAQIGVGGGRFEMDLIEQPSTNGRRFKPAKSSDVYDIDQAGNLRIYSGDMRRPFAGVKPLN